MLSGTVSQVFPHGSYPSHLTSYLPVFQHTFCAVMHFAGLKAVGESVEQSLRYYRVNLTASLNLLEVSLSSAD